jgi:hypothetical protein
MIDIYMIYSIGIGASTTAPQVSTIDQSVTRLGQYASFILPIKETYKFTQYRKFRVNILAFVVNVSFVTP